MLNFMRGSPTGVRLAALLRSGVAREVDPDALPEFWVSRWVDYSSRYGVVYQLADGAFGVYYNDSTKLICPSDSSSFDYIPRSTTEQKASRATHTFEDFPAELQKKVTLLHYLRSTMTVDTPIKLEGVVPGQSSLPRRATRVGSKQVYVRKWSRRGSAVLFLLSNKDIQVIFFDKTEVVLSFRDHAVTYSDKCGSVRTSSLSRALDGPSAELSKRLRYILANFLGVASSDLLAALRT
jgi:polo-like kinase 1